MIFAQDQGDRRDPQTAQARGWIVRLHSGEVTDRDMRALAVWRGQSAQNEQAYQAELRLWQALGQALGEPSSSVLPSRTAVGQPGVTPAVASAALSRRRFLGGTVAASAAAVLGVALVVRPEAAGARVLETATGEKRDATLAPGLDVTLNTDTRLAFWPGEGTARVRLDRGEAMIRVDMAAGALRVEAEHCLATADKAQFLLQVDGEQTRVACLSGAISIHTQGEDVVLGARRSLTLGGDMQGAPSPTSLDEGAGAWRKGLFVFENRPAGEVVAELNRYRRGYVYLPEARASLRISGVLSVDQADQAVDHVARMLGMKVVRLPGGLALLR